MRNWFAKLRSGPYQPSPAMLRSLLMLTVLAGVSAAAFFWGRMGGQATAQVPGLERLPDGNRGATEYERRVVGYLYGNVPITREDLGEYLIARFGAERLDFLLNRRIVEMECKAKNVYVTDAEVEAQLQQDLKDFRGISLADFTQTVLKRFNKTLFEWKEDVIRPKLALVKLCRISVKVTDEDVQKAFEARYGPKVQCRMIVINADNVHKNAVYQKVKQGEAEFAREAKQQAIPDLAVQGGVVPPIHKHFGDATLEKMAFNLKEGELSDLYQAPDRSWVILKCDKHLPRDNTRRLETEYKQLEKEIYDLKVSQQIPHEFAKLQKAAEPKNLLKNLPQSNAELEQTSQRMLGVSGSPPISQPAILKK